MQNNVTAPARPLSQLVLVHIRIFENLAVLLQQLQTLAVRHPLTRSQRRNARHIGAFSRLMHNRCGRFRCRACRGREIPSRVFAVREPGNQANGCDKQNSNTDNPFHGCESEGMKIGFFWNYPVSFHWLV